MVLDLPLPLCSGIFFWQEDLPMSGGLTPKLTGAVKRPVQRLVRLPCMGVDCLPMPEELSMILGSPVPPPS